LSVTSEKSRRRGHSAHARADRARQLRIIAGAWRGRRLRFPASDAIRPTPDRVRETLFNWLAGRIAGARCLDLFAGSGALGLEALSRGAAQVCFVEQDGVAARALDAVLVEWGARGAQVVRTEALQFLRGAPQTFDIVFLDPPFGSELLATAARLLESHAWLASEAMIYVECSARETLPSLPPPWTVVRAKAAGEVGYHLLSRSALPSGQKAPQATFCNPIRESDAE